MRPIENFRSILLVTKEEAVCKVPRPKVDEVDIASALARFLHLGYIEQVHFREPRL